MPADPSPVRKLRSDAFYDGRSPPLAVPVGYRRYRTEILTAISDSGRMIHRVKSLTPEPLEQAISRFKRAQVQPMKHLLPPLPYDAAALEPHIDSRTMILHHDQHHAAYVKALNLALESAPGLIQEKSAEWLLRNLSQVPENIRTDVRHNAGGHVNHSLLWKAMAPNGVGTPTGPLAEAINKDFGSFRKFKLEFEQAGSKLFGSGWVWLVKGRHGAEKLEVITTSGHDNPLMQGDFPLLVNDVWEHAYYLKHENRRPEYLKGWWPLVNWEEAARRLASSRQAVERPAADTLRAEPHRHAGGSLPA